MAKEIVFSKKARSILLRGVEKIYDVIRLTLGPSGKHAMLDHPYTPLVINDGYYIARQIVLEDAIEQMGASLVIEVGKNTNDDVGDGTTTSMILAANLMMEANRLLASGLSGTTLKRNLLELKQHIVEIVRSKSRHIRDLSVIESVATIASKDERVGKMIAQIYATLQDHVAIVVEEGLEDGLDFVIQKGLVIERGFLSKFMIQDFITKKTVLKKPQVIIVSEKYDIARVLSATHKSALIIFQQITPEDLHMINQYIVGSKKEIVAIRKDEIEEKLDDLRVLCNMELVDGMMMGFCQEVVITKNKTTLICDFARQDYIDALNVELSTALDYKKEILRQRIASLSGGVAKIRIGANSDIELQDLKYRIEDAINACHHAYLSGVSIGEGLAYVDIIPELEKFQSCGCMKQTVEMMIRCLKKPYRQIMSHASLPYEEARPYDFSKLEFVSRENFLIYDPTKVIETVICNAISVTCMFVVTDVIVAQTTTDHRNIDI